MLFNSSTAQYVVGHSETHHMSFLSHVVYTLGNNIEHVGGSLLYNHSYAFVWLYCKSHIRGFCKFWSGEEKKILCIMTRMRQLWTLYLNIIEGCNICEEHVRWLNGQLTPPRSILQEAMDCLPHVDENILVEIASLGPDIAHPLDINNDRPIHQALDQRLIKLVHG